MKLINKLNQIKRWLLGHKKTAILIILVLAFVGYKGVKALISTEGEPQYITAVAKKGEIVASVTGTGQVSASNRVDVTSEVSGDVTSVPVKLGAIVKEGQTLATVDSRDALRAVQNAELSLENAKIAYEKAKKQAEDQSTNSTVSDLNQAYEDGYTAVSNGMIDIPDIIESGDNIFYDPEHSPYFGDMNILTAAGQTALDYKYDAGKAFDLAKKNYESTFKNYKLVKVSDREKLTSLIEETYNVVKELHKSLTGAYNAIDYIKQRISTVNIPPEIAADKTALNSSISKLSNHLDTLSNALTAIEDAKDSTTEATLDLKSAELNVSKAEDDLRNAKEELANHSIRAPFSGVIGKVQVESGDRISTNAAVATIITDEKIAEVSLNEVDVAKVKIGQKAHVTFDAIDDLTMTGEVIEVDLLGTVDQGVVNYTVKIAFDKSDERIKTGMSLSASIISETREGVIRVPNAALKSQGNRNYVEALSENGTLTRIPVEIGLSNDEFTEVVSGLNEGDSFISKTVTKSSAASTQQAPSLFGSGTRSTSGGNVRIQTR